MNLSSRIYDTHPDPHLMRCRDPNLPDDSDPGWDRLLGAINADYEESRMDDAGDLLAFEERPAEFDLGAEDGF